VAIELPRSVYNVRYRRSDVNEWSNVAARVSLDGDIGDYRLRLPEEFSLRVRIFEPDGRVAEDVAARAQVAIDPPFGGLGRRASRPIAAVGARRASLRPMGAMP
jgi:hypothetical protein